ncbi:MAG: hypothetical protein OHK0047_09590 [Leptolyngbyaceae cyanobacterium]
MRTIFILILHGHFWNKKGFTIYESLGLAEVEWGSACPDGRMSDQLYCNVTQSNSDRCCWSKYRDAAS